MRTKDVRVGQTYRCEVPYSLPLGRFRPETMGPSWWTLSLLRGTHFPLTVMDIDPQARTAEGLCVASSSHHDASVAALNWDFASHPGDGGLRCTAALHP